MKEQLYHIKTADNESIALWKLNSETITGKHIFLTHGAFSNRKILDGIASYLTKKGFTCWIMEWRNHGESSKSTQKFNLETIAKFDLKATFNFLFYQQNLKSIDCITHSGGGIILTMFLINNPCYNSKINSITLFGSQAFAAGEKFSSRIKIIASKYLTALLGKAPAKTVGSTEHSERYYTMKQWYNWNLKKNFIGENNFDYLKKMNTVTVPIISICAKGDTFIAPKEACEKFLNAFKNKKNKLLFYSQENGNLENYNHSRILKSQNSKKEIWPTVENWIVQNKTIAY
ncbi:MULTISPECIES: alpha/beta hydrolase [unclassified Polaribacter]|uniref:alpha/beta hydrolase n=1 Tax=unclassified Polaribacter TaxID=196858 RepID=UPI0011BEB691|nr:MULTISPECIES: alpha/beta fold hydrolase [unclassified Polaribacter]TXD51811.1 alpha/beta hydrolase [Polaribacter sp. IC063]TXD59173.1 alpha/beta hydrolase [Polaribacter sp. IC066]